MFRVFNFAISAIAGLMVMTLVAPASAVVVVNDHFDDDVLDPAWSVSFIDATGWSPSEAGSELTVTGVGDVTDDQDWAIARLSRGFAALADFQAEIDIAWSSAANDTAVMYLQAYMVDSDGARFAMAGYHDPWSKYSGGRIASLTGSGSSFEGVFGVKVQNQSGSLSIDITRTGTAVEILWDGVTELSGSHGVPLVGIQIEFASYRFDGHRGWPEATFGIESVDRVRVEGTPVAVAEPGALALFGLALTGVALARRRRTT